MVNDSDTGEPRGIAFLEMTQATEAQAAISALNGTMLNGRPMNVNEAREASSKSDARCGPQRSSATQDVNCELVNYPFGRFSARNEMISL